MQEDLLKASPCGSSMHRRDIYLPANSCFACAKSNNMGLPPGSGDRDSGRQTVVRGRRALLPGSFKEPFSPWAGIPTGSSFTGAGAHPVRRQTAGSAIPPPPGAQRQTSYSKRSYCLWKNFLGSEAWKPPRGRPESVLSGRRQNKNISAELPGRRKTCTPLLSYACPYPV